jgi:hypothetical protein
MERLPAFAVELVGLGVQHVRVRGGPKLIPHYEGARAARA